MEVKYVFVVDNQATQKTNTYQATTTTTTYAISQHSGMHRTYTAGQQYNQAPYT